MLATLLPLGALGVSSALAAAPGKPIVPTESADAGQPGVAERLSAIRSAVSQVTIDQTGLQAGDPNILKAWWGNWAPRFWANWHPGWGNGGWHNAAGAMAAGATAVGTTGTTAGATAAGTTSGATGDAPAGDTTMSANPVIETLVDPADAVLQHQLQLLLSAASRDRNR